MKLIFNILTSVLVVIFLLMAVLLLISSFNLPGLPLDARSVLTGSMEPAIPQGSVVFIYPQAEYEEGDIVTFKRIESQLEIPITHRIIRIEEESGRRMFVTKGDGNEYEDTNSVSEEEIYGRVIFHLPLVGRLLDIARTPLGFAALIIIPALLVISDEVRKIIKHIKRREETDGEVERSEDKTDNN